MADERYMKQLGKMERPIPGQSLTNDPSAPLPFEKAPEYTNKKDALEAIFSGLIQPDTYSQLMGVIAKGTAVMDIVQMLLFSGFTQGKWNPDLFLMLIEPTAYMIMALAERVGIEYKIDNDQGEEAPPGEPVSIQKKFEDLSAKMKKTTGVKAGVLPKDIEQKIANMSPDSLLSPSSTPPTPNPASAVAPIPQASANSVPDSLLAPGA